MLRIVHCLFFLLILAPVSLWLPSFTLAPTEAGEAAVTTPANLSKVKGWSLWQPWDSFPHHRLQLGMSNTDYGGLMDLEYACFGSVGKENEEKKSQTYWYRISDEVVHIGQEDYVSIEVGCWRDVQFQATLSVTGIVLNSTK